MNTVTDCNSLRSKEPLHINGEMSQSIRQGRINGHPKDLIHYIINIQHYIKVYLHMYIKKSKLMNHKKNQN